MTLVAAAACGLVIGLIIGGLGGGGGVLTVPALVYLLGFGAQQATAGSVIVVGLSAAVGVAVRIPGRDLDWRTGLVLGAVGTPAAYAGSLLNQRADRTTLLLAFAAVTVLAAAAMLLADAPDAPAAPDAPGSGAAGSNERHGRTPPADESAARSVRTAPRQRHPRAGHVDERHSRTPLADERAVRSPRTAVATAGIVVGGGAAVGFLTGFLGVGGGFLVLPLLVVGLRTPVARAAGTSLVAILVNSSVALLSRSGDLTLDWSVLVPFTLASLGATVLGHRVAGRLSGATLTRVFAVLLLGVGIIVGVDAVRGF